MKKVKQWINWVRGVKSRSRIQDVVDEASEESFPASDSPAWTSSKESNLAPFQINDPISLLKQEHHIMMQGIYTMHHLIEQLQKNQPIKMDLLENIIEFMHEFVSKCHQEKIETILFPALQHSKAPLSNQVFDTFKQDHEWGRTLITSLQTLAHRYARNEATAKEKLIAIMIQIKDLYPAHILKEENIIFPLAEKYLSKETQQSILNQFAKIDEKIGLNSQQLSMKITTS